MINIEQLPHDLRVKLKAAYTTFEILEPCVMNAEANRLALMKWLDDNVASIETQAAEQAH